MNARTLLPKKRTRAPKLRSSRTLLRTWLCPVAIGLMVPWLASAADAPPRPGTYGPEFEFRGPSVRRALGTCLGSMALNLYAADAAYDYGKSSDPEQRAGQGVLMALPTAISGAIIWKLCNPLQMGNWTYRAEADHKKLLESLQKLCQERGDCSVEKAKGRWGLTWRVKYSDRFWIDIGVDPAVVEAQVKPQTPAELEKTTERLQRDLFDSAKRVGLKPPNFGNLLSGGHINLGIRSGFGGDARLFRNYLVDLVNHYELAAGIYLDDPYSAMAIRQDPKTYARFKKVIREFDRKYLLSSLPFDQDKAIEELSQAIHKEVFRGFNRRFQFSLRKVGDPRFSPDELVLENRAFRSQENAETFRKEVDLLESRRLYVKAQGGLIDFEEGTISRKPQILVSRFRSFLLEMGKAPEAFADTIRKDLKPVLAEGKRPGPLSHYRCVADTLKYSLPLIGKP